MNPKKVWLSWSSGKDCAWALHRLQQDGEYEVCGLFTTLNKAFDRVAMHAVRRTLLERQAEAVQLPLKCIYLPWPCSNADYEPIMSRFCAELVENGVGTVAFGDLFLEDVRNYRLSRLKDTGLKAIFPLWKLPTRSLAEEMITSGVQAKITCVNPKQLDRHFAGRSFDSSLLADLPADVDPCGENGEFHSFVHAGPMFVYPLQVSVGQIADRDGFVFADLVPAEERA